MATQISEQQARAFLYLTTVERQWVTARDVARDAEIAARSARKYLELFTKQGLVERYEVSPGYRYRLLARYQFSEPGRDLAKACEVFFGDGE